MTTTTTTNGKPQATFNQLQNETYMKIERENGQVVQCSVAYGPLVGKPQLGLYVFVPEVEDEDGPDDPRFAEDETLMVVEATEEPFLEDATLSIAEARLLRDFLNRPEVTALLDQA